MKEGEQMRKIAYCMSGIISIICYILLAYQFWHLCQYGGLRSHLPVMTVLIFLFVAAGAIRLVTGRFRRKEKKEEKTDRKKHVGMWMGLAVVVAATIYFGGRILYSALPYNGALSWKIEEWRNKKTVELTHNNFFASGVEGILEDLDRALNLPEELYMTEQFRLAFDSAGTIQSMDTFLYGMDEDGETRTYLVSYNVQEETGMTVWKDGYANADYDEDRKLSPMLRILDEAPCEEQAAAWEQMRGGDLYEILYMGKRPFQTEEGMVYLAGDANGDGMENESFIPGMLAAGGEVAGYEVSMYIPDAEEVTPVRYMMEPEYISPEQIAGEQEKQQAETAKETESWTVDSTDGSMRYFLDEQNGWKLSVVDAAAGSRFYDLSRTEDGGETWEIVNADPFAGNIGVAEGLQFFDENFGFVALSGASQSYSRMYMTKDGGSTFSEIILPMNEVTQLPAKAEEYGYTVENYTYLSMPEKNGNILTIDVLTGAFGEEGIRFQSENGGVSWSFAGIF